MSSAEALTQKTLAMIVGPSAIGKSTLMNEMVRLHDDFAYVEAFTTRAKRPEEKTHYTFIDKQAAQELLDSNQAITIIEHPTTHDFYGTTIDSYPKRYNLLDTLANSVAEYRSLPFDRTVVIAVTAPADQWHKWFIERYPVPTTEAEKRLSEAVLSINWALNDPETHWVVNTEGALKEIAERAISYTLQPSEPEPNVPEWPYSILRRIEEGIWHKK